GMQIDKADMCGACRLAGDNAAQRLVRPRGGEAAKEKPVRMDILPAGDRGLKRHQPLLGDIILDGGVCRGAGRSFPVLGHQPVLHFPVGGIVGQRGLEVAEVAVEVDIVLIDAADMGKPIRVDGVDQEDRGILGERGERVRSEEPDLKDRKSTRLNSSHVKISYAVFCLKKKTKYV